MDHSHTFERSPIKNPPPPTQKERTHKKKKAIIKFPSSPPSYGRGSRGGSRSLAMNPSVTAPTTASSSSSSSWLAGLVRGRSLNSAAGSGGGASSIPAAADGLGSGSRKNQLRGVLFKYGPNSVQVKKKTRMKEKSKKKISCFCNGAL